MHYNRFTLSFSEDQRPLEKEFRDDYFARSLDTFRVSSLIGCFFYGAFGLLDTLLLHEIEGKLWFIRFGIVCPLILIGVLASRFRLFRRYWQLLIVLLVIVAGLGIIAMIVMAAPPVNLRYYAGLILVLFFAYTLLRARFVWATLSGWVVVGFYEVAAIWIIETPVDILISNNFFFISANIIGMIACYFMEYHARRNFYLMYLLEKERDKVRLGSKKLGKKVKELREAIEKVKTLSGLIPICAHCKKIRDDRGFWNQIEKYISTHSDVEFSHSLCPECVKQLYPEIHAEGGEMGCGGEWGDT
ncbi:MAG: hypothetical protein JXD19_04055 [Deltaproteobacteria bacterium]|nr:hypothetical protein [Deltaproteobacteria bacterium]